MKFLLVILLSLPLTAKASLPELFGPSSGSIAIGNQAQKNSAANNFHAPALLGYSKTTQFSFDVFYIHSNFKDIDNVVTKNETNTVNTFDRDDVDVDPKPTAMLAAHLSMPLFSPDGMKFNLSFFAPFDRLMEADTGDPYQPRYVMYDNRFVRPILIFTGSKSFGDWSYSAGVHTGFQTNGETYFITRTTTGNPSVAKMSFNAKPSVGAVVSISRKKDKHTSYFTFQQEMKSKLENRATGETEIASNTSFQFDFDVAALLYYDPMTLRVGHQMELTDSTLFLALEYQHWENFEGPSLQLKKRGGTINGSQDYEKLKLKNIFIPKIGFEKSLSDRWIGKVGYFYRKSPLYTNNLKHSGNTIDVDKHVGSIGAAHLFKFYEKDLTLDFAYQAHLLRTQKITKTPNREDGDASEPKIGSPGYEVGGMIHVVSLGLSWMY
jgi:long-subunit fatty acid transport protein